MSPGPHLTVLKYMYIYIGWWPLKIKNVYLQKVYLYYRNFGLLWHTVVTASCGLYIQEAFIHDKDNLLESVTMTFTLFLGLWGKIVVCSSKSMCELIARAYEIDHGTLKDADEHARNFYSRYARHAKIKNVAYIFIIQVIGLSFAIFGYFEILVGQRNVFSHKKRLLLTWLPFDTDVHYIADYIINCIQNYHCTMFGVSTQTLFLTIFSFVNIELRMLQHSLRNFNRGNKNNDYQSFCLLVKKHHSIIEFVQKFSDMVLWVTFVDFLANSIIFAGALVTFVSAWDLYIFIYLPFPILPMIWIYWEANEVQVQSTLVARAVYESNWVSLNEKTKKAMLLMAVRAQKALEIPIGPFYTMSTETLITAFKVSYTYLTIFRKQL